MKRLSEYKNEAALDLLVEIMEPAAELMSDKDAVALLYSKKPGDRMKGVTQMIKEHKGAVMHILAALDGVPVDQYECSFFTLPTRLIEILNDKELLGFFMAQQMTDTEKLSSSAMESTEENGN
jgi:hypothetical protein